MIGALLCTVGTACSLTGLVLMLRNRSSADSWYLAGDAFLAVGQALNGEWAWAACFAVLGALFAWRIWRRRRDRRRALAAWGAKAKARLAVMLRTLREKAKPGPVLRPGRLPA